MYSREGACFLMSNICHVVLNSEHGNRKKKYKKSFWPTYDHFLITYFYCHFKKCAAELAGPIELKFSGSSKGWILRLYRKFLYIMTPMTDFTGQERPKLAIKIRITYFYDSPTQFPTCQQSGFYQTIKIADANILSDTLYYQQSTHLMVIE